MIYANRANARRELGEFKSAMADANQAIKLDPARPASFYTRGAVCEAEGHFKLARKDCMQALRSEARRVGNECFSTCRSGRTTHDVEKDGSRMRMTKIRNRNKKQTK